MRRFLAQKINKNKLDHKKVQEYIDYQSVIQKVYYKNIILIGEPKYYYEEMYGDIAHKYMGDLDANIKVYNDKIDELVAIQSNYNSYTVGIVSDLNNNKNAGIALFASIVGIVIASIALLIQIIDIFSDIFKRKKIYNFFSNIYKRIKWK